MRFLQNTALLALTAFLLYRGIIPALTTVDTDFPNYYTASRLFIEGRNMQKIYDDRWFQQEIVRYGMNQEGKFSPFPPATTFIMIPFAFLTPLNALRVWTVLNCGILAALIALLAHVTGKSWKWSALLTLASGHALANNFRFGQVYLFLAFFILAAYAHWVKERAVQSGALLGISAAFKYFPLVFIPYFLFRREWKLVAAEIGSLIAVIILGLWTFGLEVHKEFISTIPANHLYGNIQNPFSATFQSWNSLFRRLFVHDPALNPNPVLDLPSAFPIALALVYGAVLILLVRGFRKSLRLSDDQSSRVQFSLIMLAGLLLLPVSATYHFLLLVVPVGILLSQAGQHWTRTEQAFAVVFVLIGFIPYNLLTRFDSHGLLSVFAYPRLLLMTGLFALAVNEPRERIGDNAR
ncbi:MAG: glycosyltransferase family 87 protein [Bacteroidota bacterium]